MIKLLYKPLIALIFLLFPAFKANADFGQGCVIPAISLDYNTLENTTLYGYVLNQIDMTTYVPANQGCSNSDNTITICLATPGKAGQNPPCELITFNVNDTLKIYDNAVIASQAANHPLKPIEFSALNYNNSLCIYMPTIMGKAPVVCKAASTNNNNINYLNQNCKVSSSCYDPSANYSMSILSFSGKAVQCIKETLDKVLTPEEACLNLNDTVFTTINPFTYFQALLKNAVQAALLLYIIFLRLTWV